jgi:hypothetical protein
LLFKGEIHHLGNPGGRHITTAPLEKKILRNYIQWARKVYGAGVGPWGEHFKLGFASSWLTPIAGLRERDFSVGPLIVTDYNAIFQPEPAFMVNLKT